MVTTNIRQDGNRIDLHNIGANQPEKARKEIEQEFKLVKAESKQNKQKLRLKQLILRKLFTDVSLQRERSVSDFKIGCLYLLGARITEPDPTAGADPTSSVTPLIAMKGEFLSLPLPDELKEKIMNAEQGEFSFENETVIKEKMALKRDDVLEDVEYTYIRKDKVTISITTSSRD